MSTQQTTGEWYSPLFYGTDEQLDEQRRYGIEPAPVILGSGERVIMARLPDGDTKRIAAVDCQTPYKRGAASRSVCAERDANARLIAAAPELVAALSALLAEVTTPDQQWVEGSAVNRARAALSLAGQQGQKT